MTDDDALELGEKCKRELPNAGDLGSYKRWIGAFARAVLARVQADSQVPVEQDDKWNGLLVERLKIHAADVRNTAFSRSTMKECLEFLQVSQPTIAPSVAHRGGDAWISVEDRLPEPGKPVLIAFSSGGVDLSFYINRPKSTGWEGVDPKRHDAPTHWMPLLAAPQQSVDMDEQMIPGGPTRAACCNVVHPSIQGKACPFCHKIVN